MAPRGRARGVFPNNRQFTAWLPAGILVQSLIAVA